jgi:hypothetical protein
MRKPIILLLLCFWFLGANAQAPPSNMDVFDGCGMDGSAKTANLKKLNQMKNRYAAPQPNEMDQSITLSAILAPGDDKTRWSPTSGAEVTGFVLDVKPGGRGNMQLWQDGPRPYGCSHRAGPTRDRHFNDSKRSGGGDAAIASNHGG